MENDIILACKRKCIAIRLTFKRKELHSFSFFLHIIKRNTYNYDMFVECVVFLQTDEGRMT